MYATQRPICSKNVLSWSCHPIETLTNLSSLSVLPSTPIGEHRDGERSIRGSCFWLQLVSSTEILLRQSFILKCLLVQMTNKELSRRWQYPVSRTTWMMSFVLSSAPWVRFKPKKRLTYMWLPWHRSWRDSPSANVSFRCSSVGKMNLPSFTRRGGNLPIISSKLIWHWPVGNKQLSISNLQNKHHYLLLNLP